MADGVTKLASITIPADWWNAAGRLAKRRKETRSALMRSLLWDALTAQERSRLSQPAPPGRQRVKIGDGGE